MKDLVTHEILKTYFLTDEVSDEEDGKLFTWIKTETEIIII
jgi:hypothetical protein